MKKIIPIIFLIQIHIFSSAQGSLPDKRNYFLEGLFQYGSILPHRIGIKHLRTGPLFGYEFKFGIQTTSNNLWKKIYNQPEVGFGFYGANLGNSPVLGNPNAIYSFIRIPFKRGQKFIPFYQIATGLTYNLKPYDPVDNPENLAIGSELNQYFNLSIGGRLKINTKLCLINEIGFTHFSNAAVKKPNRGINSFSYKLGLNFNTVHQEFIGRKYEIPDFEPLYEFYIFYGAGLRQHDPGDEFYFTSTISTGLLRQYGHKGKYGIGMDIFYDETLYIFVDDEPFLKYALKQGFFLSHEFIISGFSIVTQLGIYTYQKSFAHHTFYNRIGLKYKFSKHFFTNISIKSHSAKADFIEAGLGYYFLK